MKSRKYDGSVLRKVLCAMVMDDTVASRVASQWGSLGGLFDAKFANIVGQWVVDYVRKYSKAPRSEVQAIFANWATSSNQDETTVNAIETFLVGVSDEEIGSTDYTLDLAGKYFNKVRLKAELEAGLNDLERGFLDDAQTRIDGLRKIELGVGSYCTPSKDYSVWSQAFEQEVRKPLLNYPGALGEFFGNAFLRNEFYAFMGPDKTGKTTFLLDFAYRAARNRQKVVFFDTGDSDQDEVMIRLGSRVTRQPEFRMECTIPVSWEEELVTKTIMLDPVEPTEGFRQFKRLNRNPDAFRVSCHSNSSLSVQDMDNILSDWAREGWVPDVIIVDYADILAPPSGAGDSLTEIDLTWKQLRKLSQDRHACVMTATQSNAAAYGKEKGLLSRNNFSGRKTKLAHVNGMIGINVSDEERQLHMARLNWVVRRKMRNRARQAYVNVVGCFDIENPIILSKW